MSVNCYFMFQCIALPKQPYFELIVDRVENIFETPSILQWQIRVKKVNKTRSLFGFLTYNEPIGNNIKVGAKVLKKQGNLINYECFSF